MGIGKQTACYLQSPSQTHPQRQPGRMVYGLLLGCHRKGKASLISERFFFPLKNHCFQILLCNGENYKRLFPSWPDCYLLYQLHLKMLFSHLGEFVCCLKLTINQIR